MCSLLPLLKQVVLFQLLMVLFLQPGSMVLGRLNRNISCIATESITATDQSIATLNLSKDAHKVNVSGVATIDCQGGTGMKLIFLLLRTQALQQ